MTIKSYKELSQRGLDRLIPRLINRRDTARSILLRIGYPAHHIPDFHDADSFWPQIFIELENELIADGFVSLLEEVRQRYSYNKELACAMAVRPIPTDDMARTAEEFDLGKCDGFVSYNSSDKPEVTRIVRELEAAGLCLWFDEDHILPGEQFSPAIESAIRRCRHVLIVIGPKRSDHTSLGPYQRLEVRDALFVRESKPARLVIPLLLPGVTKLEDDIPLPLHSRSFGYLQNLDPSRDVENWRRIIRALESDRPSEFKE